MHYWWSTQCLILWKLLMVWAICIFKSFDCFHCSVDGQRDFTTMEPSHWNFRLTLWRIVRTSWRNNDIAMTSCHCSSLRKPSAFDLPSDFSLELPVVQDGVKKLNIHQGSGQVLKEYVPPIWYHWLKLEVNLHIQTLECILQVGSVQWTFPIPII